MEDNHRTIESRQKMVAKMYSLISGVTAECRTKDQTFVGSVKELFESADVSKATVTRFLWAISHKTSAIPTVLFSVKNKSRQGCEIKRLRSGFRNEKGEHVVGLALVPYLMKAMCEYERPIHENVERHSPVKKSVFSIDYANMSDDELRSAIEILSLENDKRKFMNAMADIKAYAAKTYGLSENDLKQGFAKLWLIEIII